MSKLIHIPSNQSIKSLKDQKKEFQADLAIGLNKTLKQIPSKYFYDEHGSELFNQITRHPDYYLTQCETHILDRNKTYLSELLHNAPFNLIELGPGEGIKTKILMQQFLLDAQQFNYLPIDISDTYLEQLIKQFGQTTPALEVTAIHSDYINGLKWLSVSSDQRNFVLFLGSSIGNFDLPATISFLQELRSSLHVGDYLLIGFDLRKDIDILLQAYNDSDGITRDFNLNLLKRINRELNADFSIKKFRHYGTYNVSLGAMESYLVSLVKQTVHIDALQQSFDFEAFEPIHVEYSYKYLLSHIHNLAEQTGFHVVKNFSDAKEYFVDSLWQVKAI